MIKLKDLITEATFKWSTAHHKRSVPDDVINMGHQLIATSQKDDPDTHPEFWMTITQRPFLGTHLMDSHDVRNDVWYIDKPGQHNNSRYWILAFHENTKKWYSVYIKNGEITQRLPVANDASLTYVIDNWGKG
jgi:hypothetical protein